MHNQNISHCLYQDHPGLSHHHLLPGFRHQSRNRCPYCHPLPTTFSTQQPQQSPKNNLGHVIPPIENFNGFFSSQKESQSLKIIDKALIWPSAALSHCPLPVQPCPPGPLPLTASFVPFSWKAHLEFSLPIYLTFSQVSPGLCLAIPYKISIPVGCPLPSVSPCFPVLYSTYHLTNCIYLFSFGYCCLLPMSLLKNKDVVCFVPCYIPSPSTLTGTKTIS